MYKKMASYRILFKQLGKWDTHYVIYKYKIISFSKKEQFIQILTNAFYALMKDQFIQLITAASNIDQGKFWNIKALLNYMVQIRFF